MKDLKQICKEEGREDLYEPLSHTIILVPTGRNIDVLTKANDRFNHSIAAFAMLYQGDNEQAVKYFKRVLELADKSDPRYGHTETIVANIDDVARIAKKYWIERATLETKPESKK